MNIRSVKIRRVGACEDAATWSRLLADARWATESRLLKHDADSWVRRVTIEGRSGDVVIKCRPAGGPRESLKRLFRASRGDRHWRGAAWLLANGFDTAAPLVLATAVVDGCRCELLVTDFIRARSVLQHLAARDLPVAEEHDTVRALVTMIVRMKEKGRYNRDGKPSNLLLIRGADGTPRIATIDTVAIRRGEAKSRQMVAPLIIEAIGCGCEPRQALKARFISELVRQTLARHALDGAPHQARRAAVRLAWRIVEEDVQRHGDPRPRVDPLGAPAQEKAHAP